MGLINVFDPLSFWLFASAISLYCIYGIIYRLYLGRVAKFPGCKLAALTFWYEFYHDIISRREYVWEIGKMYEQYGMDAPTSASLHTFADSTLSYQAQSCAIIYTSCT